MSGVYTTQGGGPQGDTTIRDLLAVVFRRKWIILGIFLVTTGLVVFNTLSSPVTWSADATLLLNRQGQRASVLEGSGRALPWVEVVESEIEVVRSTPVLQRAQQILAEPAGTEEPLDVDIGSLSRAIRSGVVGESNILYVTATARQPGHAIRIANAVAAGYAEYHDVLFELPDASGAMQDQADSTFATLREKQAERGRIYQELGTTNLEDVEKAQINHREALRSDLSKVERQISRLRTEIEDTRESLSSGLQSIPFEQNTGSVQGNSLFATFQQLRDKRSLRAQLLLKYTPSHPELVQVEQDIARLARTVQDGLEELLAIREHELRVARAEERDLRRQITDIDRRLGLYPQRIAQLQLLESEIASLSKQYAELSQESVESQVRSVSFQDYGVKILSPAVSARKNKKGDMVRMALAPMLALVAGVGLAFYLENLDHSLANRDDIERHLEIPVLASLPEADVSGGSIGSRGSPRRSIPFAGRRGGRGG